MFWKWGSMDERTREYRVPAKLLPAGHLHIKAAFLEQRISTNNPINIDSLPFLKCLLLVVHFPVRSTHPFFWGYLAPADLVLCPSHEHRASTLTERGGGLSFDIVTISSIFITLSSQFIDGPDMENNTPGVKPYTHERKHPETRYSVCSPFSAAVGNRRVSWDRKSVSALHPQRSPSVT